MTVVMGDELGEAQLKAFENLFGQVLPPSTPDDENQLPEAFLSLNENLISAVQSHHGILQRLVSAECAEIQEDEMVALMAIYENEMTVTDADCKCFKVNLRKTEIEDELIDIWFSIPINYPNDLPIFELDGHGLLSYQKADELYTELLQEASRMKHQTMIYALVELAKDYLEKNVPRKPKPSVKKELSVEEKENSEDDNDDYEFYDNYHHGNFKPTKFTGPIHNLIDKIPKHLQLVSIENILRSDLAHRYQECRAHFNHKYGQKARIRDKEYLLTNSLGFHGTDSNNMGNIIRSGLKVPGTDGVQVKHGSAYGVGIYLSPDPTYSLNYSSDTKTLLVCSVLMGRCLKLGENTKLKGSFDSVISPTGFEMVFFSADQVLPCFVIKLADKLRNEDSVAPKIVGAYASTIGKAQQEDDTPEEKLEKAKKRASKYLPFGYGPSNMILGVADSSDDEEEYGEYQEYRSTYVHS